MKRLNVAAGLFLLALAVTGCEKKPIYVDFETESSFKLVIPANSLLSTPLSPLNFAETSNAEGEYASNDTRKDLLESVTIKSFLLEVETPVGEDLSMLNTIQFFINADGLVEALFAEKDPVPSGVAEVLLDVPTLNLAPYMKSDAFTLRTRVVTDEARTQDVTINALVKYNVRAEVIGQD